MTPRRLCFVTTFYPPAAFGGDAIGIQRIARALAKRDYEVTVVHDADAHTVLSRPAGRAATAPDEGPPGGRPEEMDRACVDEFGVRVVTLRSRAPLVSTLLTQQLGRPVVNGRRLRTLLGNGRFDVIIYNNVSLIGGPGILAYGNGAAKLYLAHEHWLVCPTHVLWRHNRERCDHRECLRCQVHYRRPIQLWRHSRLLADHLSHVDTFVAMSEFSRQKHLEFGFPREMVVLPYFLPAPEDVAPVEPTGRPHDRSYFLFVGRLERIKGLDDVIQACARYEDADLVIIGEGTHGEALRRLAADNPRVRFVGRVAHEQLGAYYRHALGVLACSTGYETFGLTLIEAFSHGTPVIARRIGPYPEIVSKSAGGLLFETAEELLAALRTLQHDPARRRALGCSGYDAWRRFWSEEAVLPDYIRLIHDTWARRRGMHA